MKLLKTIMASLTVFAALSCTKNQADGFGQVSFVVSSDNVVADQTKSNVSDYTSLPSANDFTMVIKNSESAAVYTGTVGEWDPASKLNEGSYSVVVSYGDLESEGFDKPYFYGTANFAIAGGEAKTVSINATLENTIVKVVCSENFKKYFSDYTFKLKRGNSEIVTFVKEEERAAFIDGYLFNLEAVIKGETKTYEINREYKNLDVATAYTLAFDVTNVGGAGITISFNNNVETVELGDHELND